MRIGIVGATGALGKELVAALAEASEDDLLALEPPVVFARPATAGETIAWVEDEELEVEAFSEEAARGLDAVILAVPAAVAAEVTPVLQRLGVVVFDASRAHAASAPSFFAEAPNPAVLRGPIISLPTAEALLAARILAPLRALKPAWVRATVLLAASGAGVAGVDELAEATAKLLNGQEPEAPKLPHRLAFNLVPQAGAFAGDTTDVEKGLAVELQRLVSPELAVGATVGWGPWFYGHAAMLSIGFAEAVTPDAVRELLREAPAVKLLDDPAQGVYPMPSLAVGDDAALVGRVRADGAQPGTVSLVAALDNVRATAAHAIETLRAFARARSAH